MKPIRLRILTGIDQLRSTGYRYVAFRVPVAQRRAMERSATRSCRLCAEMPRQSPYNPHYPYSLQFNVNTNGYLPELPHDAFWKTGSAGHVLYMAPSLDLVVWKLGGRDEQYRPENTGLAVHPQAAARAEPREGWEASVDKETAIRKTLQMVIDAIEEVKE